MKAKRVIIFMLAFAMLLSLSAFADIAYEPADNFYRNHWDECGYENRWYITNGSTGCAVVFSSPTGSAREAIPNGARFYVSYTWKGEWGCIEYDPDTLEHSYGSSSGWVRMADMVPEYDNLCFRADHEGEIVSEEFTLELSADWDALGYRYPGSGIVTTAVRDYSGSGESITFSEIYTDAEGLRWGYVGYYYGMRNFWICLDDPYAELAAGAEFTEPEIIPAADEAEMLSALKAESPLGGYAAAGAAGLVIIAASVMAYILIRKKKLSR